MSGIRGEANAEVKMDYCTERDEQAEAGGGQTDSVGREDDTIEQRRS